MRIKFLSALLSMLILTVATSCSNENSEINADATATLTISLVAPKSRAVAPASSNESVIKNMTVLVFDDGELEVKQEIKGSAGLIPKLKTGHKVVTVITNPSVALTKQIEAVKSYEELSSLKLDLADELNAQGAMNEDKGLTMSGEGEISLLEGSNNRLDMEVTRVVAKITLGSVNFMLDEGFDTDEFVVTGVSVMKVREQSLLGFKDYLLPTEEARYLGGMIGEVSTTQDDRYKADVKIGDNNTYFYVLPNDNSGKNSTLMTLTGTYKGVEQFFAFAINDKVVKGAEKVTGNFIQPNHEYTLNVLIKKPIGGDPEDPRKPATLEVTVSVKDWVVVPPQIEEW